MMQDRPGGHAIARRGPSTRVRRRRTLWGATALMLATAVILVPLVRSSGDDGPGVPEPIAVPTAPVAAAPPSLDRDMAAILDEAGGYRVGVALADVSGGTTRTFGDRDPFFAASTAKIITAAAYYHRVETGEARLDEPLGDYDAAFQLQAMVNTSSNDAWLLLMDAVGHSELTAYASSLGVEYDPEENLLTAEDMALVLRRLSAGELLDEEHTTELLGYMQDTNEEDLIPAGSRADVLVQHKYGQVAGELHDAALLTYRGSTIALVVYTEAPEDGGTTEQTELIREVTRAAEAALFPTGG
ncbi:serine hydrolase [Arthrobacter sp. KR32]|uniref:Serine hydrolase n=2 Tax=Arthrobacter bussei TaxID=2594179 RepID=A0A7X1NS78_9MICC|nr:serine hydrolase [Arthrobacter bussei]